MSIVLIGATGRTGRLIAQRLHAAAMPFHALIRNAAKRDEIERLGGTPIVADLLGDFSHAFERMDTVIFAAGSAESEGQQQEISIDRDAVVRSVDYAKHHGVRRFVVISALLAADPEHASEAMRHYSRMKREADDYVVASGLDYLVLRPGPLDMEPARGTIALTTDASARVPVARDDVAAVTVEAVQRGIKHAIIGFIGGTMPIADALALA